MGLLQELSDPGLTGVADTAVKTTKLKSCNGTVWFLQNSYLLDNSLNEEDNFFPCRCTRELSNNHKIICHELKAYPNLMNLSLNHFNGYFRVGVQTQNNSNTRSSFKRPKKKEK